MISLAEIKNSKIILDTCVLQYLDNKYSSEEVAGIISQLQITESLNVVSMSQYSIMELLTSATADREEQLIKIAEAFTRYFVSEEILRGAAQLHALYREDGIDGKIGEGDRIIAVTAIMEDGVIITANGRDFPRPFFNEIYKQPITVRGDKITIYFLRPDINLITERFLRRKR